MVAKGERPGKYQTRKDKEGRKTVQTSGMHSDVHVAMLFAVMTPLALKQHISQTENTTYSIVSVEIHLSTLSFFSNGCCDARSVCM